MKKMILVFTLMLTGTGILNSMEPTVIPAKKIVPMGMGVMQISFSPYDNNERVTRIVDTIKNLLRYAKNDQKAIINTALIYSMGESEKLLAQALDRLTAEERKKLIVLTWVGLEAIAMEEEKMDHSLVGPESMYTKSDIYDQFINQSYKNLKIDQFPEIELWVGLHRVNPYTSYEQIEQLKKIKDFYRVSQVGLSEVSLTTLKKFDEVVKIGFLETELSLSRQFVLHDNILETCKKRNILFLAYSPLDRGIWTSAYDDIQHWLMVGKQHPFLSALSGWNNEEIVQNNYQERQKAVKIAQKDNMLLNQLALAWIMKKGAIPIPDSTSPERSALNFQAIELQNKLTEDDMDILDSIEFIGKRYH